MVTYVCTKCFSPGQMRQKKGARIRDTQHETAATGRDRQRPIVRRYQHLIANKVANVVCYILLYIEARLFEAVDFMVTSDS